MADTFNEITRQTTGSYAGDYLWSAATNWSTGLPQSTDAVSLNLSGSPSAIGTSVSVASVTYDTAGSLLIGGSLSTGSLSGTVSGAALSVLAGGSLQVAGRLSMTGGALDIAGGASIGSLGLKSLSVEGTVTASTIGGGLVTINRGGTLEVATGTDQSLSVNGDAFTLDGGSLKLDSSVLLLGGTSFSFGAGASYGASSLYIGDTGNFRYNSLNYAINGFDVGDSIQIANVAFAGATYNGASHTLLLTGSNGGPSYTINDLSLAASVGTPTFKFSAAAGGGTVVTLNCFLAGTRIETPSGLVAIEELSVGDAVVVIEAGARTIRPLRWIGRRHVDPAAMDGEAARQAAPVRIRAHAFADDIPARDLLVTADHCVLDHGGLIPARMLVNGTSIVRQPSDAAYDVYHIAFDAHSIVLAEGLTTESFLDTGGDTGFATALSDRTASWERDAAAPLTTARTVTEPVWHRLAARAETLGMGVAQTGGATEMTADPALRVRLPDGTLLRARQVRGARCFFVLPAGCASAVLHSRSAVPADVEGPFVDDRRRLGVRVGRLLLWSGLRSADLLAGGAGQPGWHPPEAAGAGRSTDGCWTDGAGALVLPMLTQPTILEVEILGTARYPMDARDERLLRA